MTRRILKYCFKTILPFLPSASYQKNKGYCPCCDSRTFFVSLNAWFRDYYHCILCSSIPRERALMLMVEKYCPNWRTLSIHESSPNKSGASLKLQKQCKNYIGSQYFPSKTIGETHDGYLNQNLEEQTFFDETFDLVITQDVFEHVFDPGRAFKEIYRTLKPGGAHIFSVPIINRHEKSEIWAQKDKNGTVRFVKTPEYHSNPVDRCGSPVAMHWGFDIVDFIRTRTGMETVIEDLYDLEHGLSARFLEIFISRKATRMR
jgi:SAM-dependent methyltransferase